MGWGHEKLKPTYFTPHGVLRTFSVNCLIYGMCQIIDIRIAGVLCFTVSYITSSMK